MELDFEQIPEQRQRNLPRLIEANYLLNLSTQALETVIATELEANPALETEDRTVCPLCGGTIEGGYCVTCYVSQEKPADEVETDDFWDRGEVIYQPPAADEGFDELSLIAGSADLTGELLADLHTVLDPEDVPVAEWIVNALDERGFLDVPTKEIALILNRSQADVCRILRVVQEMAPAGVAARDLRESLLLQLEFLRQSGVEVPPLVETIVNDHLSELGNHRYQQIARHLKVQPEDIGDAHDFIHTHLSPHPLQSYESRTWQSPAQTPYVVPDVLINIVDDELRIEITGSSQGQLRVNPLYNGLASSLRRRRRVEPNGATAEVIEQTSEEDRDHIRDSVSRARQFISKIHQRRETLLKISTCICELQEDFLREGVRELHPLTRSFVAQQIGVHESTVSRATANKFVMLPNRKVIPFSDFFTASLSVKDVIKELIETESQSGRPMSDMRIRELLLQRGYRIARRTVAKYRAELNILPSTVR